MNERQVNILLVDDSEQGYATIQNLLSKIQGWQFNLERVTTYQNALEKIKTNQPVICLLNPHLKETDGLQRLHQTFENGAAASLILMTTPDDSEAITKVLSNGAVDYLVKDQFNASQLEQSIRYALKYQRFRLDLRRQTAQLEEENKRLKAEIIQWKHKEAVRQESEKVYRELFDVDIYGVEVLDSEGNILDCNTTYEHMLGYSREEILGRHAVTFTTDRGGKRFKKKLTLLKKRGYTEGEIELVAKDGTKILVWQRMRALHDDEGEFTGAVAYSRDITERMKAVRQISALARALEQSPIATMIIDPDGIIEYVNFRFTELTGYAYEEAVGQHLRHVKSAEESPEAYEEIWRAVRGGEEWHGDFYNVTKEGAPYWELVTVAPMYSTRGDITHYIITQEDITTRKQAEEEAFHSQRRVGDLMSEHISDLTLANEELQREVEERKRIEKTLQRSRARLKAQYKGIPVPTYTWQRAGDDFVLVDYNDAAERDSQGRIADFMGKPVSQVFKNNPQVMADFARCFANQSNVRREAPYTLVTTGETKYYVTTYNYVPPHLVIVHIQDITEQKRIEEKLRQAEEELANYHARVQVAAEPSEDVAQLKAHLQEEMARRERAEQMLRERHEQLDDLEELKEAWQREVTRREQAEQALQESEKRFKEVAGNIDDRLREQYRSIPVPTYSWQRIANEFILIDFNDAAAKMMGRIVDFFGKPASEIFKDRPEVLADFERCYQEKGTIQREAPYTLVTSGETRFFVTTYHFVPPNLVIDHIQDITEQKQMEAELMDYRQRVVELETRLAELTESLQQETEQRRRAEQQARRGPSDQQSTTDIEEQTVELNRKNEELQHKLEEYRQVQDAFHETRLKLKAQYKSIPLPTYSWQRVGDDFVLVDYNDAAEKSSNGRIASFMSKSVKEVFKHRAQVLADFERCYAEKRTIVREAPYRLVTTGEVRHYVTTYNFIAPNTVLVYIQDVTEHKQLEEALHVSEEQIQLQCHFSPDLKLTAVNEAFRWYFEQDKEALLGQTLPFILEEDHDRVKTHFISLNQDKPAEAIEYRVIKPDGSVHWQRWMIRAIFKEGQVVEYRAAGKDITRRKAEERLPAE